jgi:tetratricopeptide (TPR) repeat protein
MNGLVIVALVALGALGLMRLLGLRGPALTLAAAALAFGAAGYALRGNPGLGGVRRAGAARPAPPSLAEARARMMGQFSASGHWLIIADSYARRGATAEAVGILRSGVREHPRDYALWVGLGNALSDHARTITPAARFAFDRAAALAPRHPAPRFFLGLSLARSGEPEQALEQWRQLLADAPADASWRPLVEDMVLFVGGTSGARAGQR